VRGGSPQVFVNIRVWRGGRNGKAKTPGGSVGGKKYNERKSRREGTFFGPKALGSQKGVIVAEKNFCNPGKKEGKGGRGGVCR